MKQKNIINSILTLTLLLFSNICFSQCWFTSLAQDIETGSNEFKNFINTNEEAFASYEILYTEASALKNNVDELTLVSSKIDEIKNAGGYIKWKNATGAGGVLGSIVKNGNKIEYTNPAGKLIKWDEQLEQGISSSIISKKSSAELGDVVEGKVGEFVQSKKKIEGFNQIFKRTDGSTAAELDIITADEIIECKRNISLARSKFTLNEQAAKISKSTDADFVNPYSKRKILYIDEPLPRNSSGELFPSDKQYIDNLKDNGIDFANSLQELKNLLK